MGNVQSTIANPMPLKKCILLILFSVAAAGFAGCQMLASGPKPDGSLRQIQFDWGERRAVTTFSFESNGCYAVVYSFVAIDQTAWGTNDTGHWSWERKDRILMVSDTLLPKSRVGREAFSLSLSTIDSAEYNLAFLKEVLNTMTNATFGSEEIKLAARRTMASSDESFHVKAPVIFVNGQGTLGKRTDIQTMIAELKRMRVKPARFTVSCDLKQEGERVLLKPEMSKESTFRDFYGPSYFAVKPNDYPIMDRSEQR